MCIMRILIYKAILFVISTSSHEDMPILSAQERSSAYASLQSVLRQLRCSQSPISKILRFLWKIADPFGRTSQQLSYWATCSSSSLEATLSHHRFAWPRGIRGGI